MNGWTIESGSKVTVGSIHVDPGSTIVTPASMCSRLIRSRSATPAAASSTRVLTPSVSVGIGCDEHPDAPAGGDDSADGVGEVQLALRVRRREPVERRPERVAAPNT